MAAEFIAWSRSGIHDLGEGAPQDGRRQASVELKLEPIQGGQPEGGRTPFELMGPLDVDGLMPGTVVGRVPAPGSIDASEKRLAHVELSPDDLPWRFTPETPDAVQQRLKPWIVLVVAKAPEAEFVGERVRLAQPALEKHRLSDSSGWAHVHALADGTRRLARIVSPRDLDPDTDYVAVLLPAFAEDSEDPKGIKPSWHDEAGTATVRWYDRWAFRTGPDGDFQTIAARLQPKTAEEIGGSFGIAEVAHPKAAERLKMRAALAAIPSGGAPPDAAPPPGPVAESVQALTEPLAEPPSGKRWILELPGYDKPWPGPDAPWREALRADPRRRGAAGLGAWAAIEWQERITDAAAAQAGALAAAAQRIRHLTFGLAAARSLWRRRVPKESNPAARLALLGPALERIPAAGHSFTALVHIDGRVPGRLVPALFSSAARRVLRPGPARSAHAAPGAGGLEAVLKAANRCPPAPEPDPLAAAFGEIFEGRASGIAFLEELIDRVRERLPDKERERFESIARHLREALAERPMAPPDLISALDPGGELPPDLDLLERSVEGLWELRIEDPEAVVGALRPAFGGGGGAPACRPFDLGALGGAIAAAVDPTVERPVVVDRVLVTIPQGLEEPLLAPPDLSPELDLPLWKFLDERQRDWLLPGVGRMPSDSVAMVQTNPAFVDAFLLGANEQTLGELRWRNLPVRTGWTPMRRFWSRFPAPGKRNTDIEGVALWPPDSELGDPRHRTDPAHGEDLVVVFHTELFRRYPSTLVYLFPAESGAGGAPGWDQTPNPVESQRLYPIFNGSIGPEVVFFGFAASPQQGGSHWVVLEEPPPGFRFGPPPPAGAVNGAVFAATTFRRPMRVFLGDVL
jgi:hypothetical protein